MKINLSEQISKMTIKEQSEDGMDVTSINEYLQKNEKVAEYVSWIILAYKNDKMELLKKFVDMCKKEGFGTPDTMALGDQAPVETEPEAPVEETPPENSPEESLPEETPAP